MRQLYVIVIAFGIILPFGFVKADRDSTQKEVITRQDVGATQLSQSDRSNLDMWDKLALKVLSSPRLNHLAIKFIGFADSLAPEMEGLLDKIQPACKRFLKEDAADVVKTALRMFPKALTIAESELDSAIARRGLKKDESKPVPATFDRTPKSDLKAK